MATLRDLRPVYVVGIGFHRYQKPGDTPYVQLGLTAVRQALADAGIGWPGVQSVYTGTALAGMAISRPMLRHLGSTGVPMTHIENASASGSSAFRMACHDVAAGLSDVSLALGIDKHRPPTRAETGVGALSANRAVPATHFALLADEYMQRYGATPEQIAAVAVKNHANGAHNPYAQRQQARSLEEVMQSPPISGTFGKLQCCPVGEGAAAVLVASEDAIARLGIDRGRCVRVLSSAQRSEELYGEKSFDAELTRVTTADALRDAGVEPGELDVVELHDAFTIEEVQYVEAMGLCGEGEAVKELERGVFHIGGRVAVSPSGGLLAMGHPVGPTGAGQIGEIVRQLRGEAGVRQHEGARTGLAHMVGVGAVCVVSVLAADH
jgi:acetyl-CoA acetyltransferase